MQKKAVKLCAGAAFVGICSGPGYAATIESIDVGMLPKALSAPVIEVGVAAKVSETKQMDQGEDIAASLGLSKKEKLQLLSQRADKLGHIHTRYQQIYDGLPVWGQQIVVHQKKKAVFHANGNVVRGLKEDLIPVQAAKSGGSVQALKLVDADAIMAKWLEDKTSVALVDWDIKQKSKQEMIYVHFNGKAYKAIVLQFLAHSEHHIPVRPTLIIRQKDGRVLKAWDRMTHAEESGQAKATGPGGNEKTGKYVYGTDYDFIPVTETESGCSMESKAVQTFDLKNQDYKIATTPHLFPCLENTERPAGGAFAPMNDAHFFGNITTKMFEEWVPGHGLPLPLQLKVHFSENFNNAGWDGLSVLFGDGGYDVYPMTDVNIVAHEITHAFTEAEGNSQLEYFAEPSGAINESFSDIAAEAAEYYWKGEVDWMVGADITRLTTALRYFEDPSMDGVSINHIDDYTPDQDMHYASGIFNRAYYLLANTDGWNPKTAFQVFAWANQNYWTKLTTFGEAACGVIQASEDAEFNGRDVINAFAQVGVVCRTHKLDSDSDAIPDGWEWRWNMNPDDPADGMLDADEDGLSNSDEFINGTNLRVKDTDQDSLSDGDEVNVHHTDPMTVDSDGDTLQDGYEIAHSLDPNTNDAELDLDQDGVTNIIEFQIGTLPNDPTSKPERISNLLESFEGAGRPDWEYESVSPERQWRLGSKWASDGNQSLVMRGLQGSESASFQFTGLFDDGTLSFDFKVSTEEDWDNLILEIDGSEVLLRSGDKSGSFSLDMAEGVHTLKFSYIKDESFDELEDTVWVDHIRFNGTNSQPTEPEPENPDLDGDGLPNDWEVENGFDPADPSDALEDFDGDGLSNLEEYLKGTPWDKVSDVDLRVTFDELEPETEMQIHYQAVVTNVGENQATEVVLSHLTPNELKPMFIASSWSDVTCESNEAGIRCQIPYLESGETVSLDFMASTANDTTVYALEARVSAEQNDLESANNRAIISLTGSSQQLSSIKRAWLRWLARF